MARYIDADALLKAMNEVEEEMENHMCIPSYATAKGCIKDIPTADVVEVVRCLECVHCDPENRHCDHPMGTTLPIGRKETDFCSYGKKVE